MWSNDNLQFKNVELFSMGKEGFYEKDNFTKALAEREELNRDGRLMTIIFLRTLNNRGLIKENVIKYRAGSIWIH